MTDFIWLLDEAPDLEGTETIELLEEWILDPVEELMPEEDFLKLNMKEGPYVS